MRNTDHDWEQLGQADPYWAVVTLDEFRSANLSDEAQNRFFEMGERYVSWAFQMVRTHFDAEFAPQRTLDFGCGVGRLLLPLAKQSKIVVGVDVAESMLEAASSILQERGVDNVSLVKGDETLSRLEGEFDCINSFITFQHIPAERGLQIFRHLLDHLSEEGVGILHFAYSREFFGSMMDQAWPPITSLPHAIDIRRGLREIRRAFAKVLRGLRERRPRQEGPTVSMFPYTLNPIFHVLQEKGIRRMHVEFTAHGSEFGAVLFFRRSPKDAYSA